MDKIFFDDVARTEFLTGFHSRKLARTLAAKTRAAQREHQFRLQARADQRRLLRERAAANAKLVETAYGNINVDYDDDEDEDDDWAGISDNHNQTPQQHFQDDQHLATVTVIEDFDPHSLIHGTQRESKKPDSAQPASSPTSAFSNAKQKKVLYQKQNAGKARKTKKKSGCIRRAGEVRR